MYLFVASCEALLSSERICSEKDKTFTDLDSMNRNDLPNFANLTCELFKFGLSLAARFFQGIKIF